MSESNDVVYLVKNINTGSTLWPSRASTRYYRTINGAKQALRHTLYWNEKWSKRYRVQALNDWKPDQYPFNKFKTRSEWTEHMIKRANKLVENSRGWKIFECSVVEGSAIE